MVKVAYILSAGRSGSTLLNLLLGSHPDAIAVGELTHLPKNLALNTNCSCGAAVSECSVWAQVIERMSKELGADLSRDPYALELGYIGASTVRDRDKLTRHYRLLWKLRRGLKYSRWVAGTPRLDLIAGRFDTGISNTGKVYEAIRDICGKDIVVDSSKDYLKGVGIYRSRPSDTRLILLTRDGRASYNSRLRSGFKRERSLKAWKNYYTNALPLVAKKVDEDHLLRVRYEDIAAAPSTEIQRICKFLGIEFDENMLDFASTTHHIVNGNRMRFRTDSRIRLDKAWLSELGLAERGYFEKHAGSLNRRLGYM